MFLQIVSGIATLGVAIGASVAAPTLIPEASPVDQAAITDVAHTELGGGYSPYLFAGCDGLTLTVTDPTPSTVFDYTVKLEDEELPVLDLQDQGNGNLELLTICPAGLAPDLNYDLVLGEAGEDSEPYVWTFEQVSGPVSGAPATAMTAGQPASIKLNGSWELGTNVETKVIASKAATREQAMQNADSELNIASTYDTTTQSVKFTIPVAATGRYLWVSAKGTRPGLASYGVFINPVKVSAPAQPSAFPRQWVKSPGKKKGVAKVGRTVRLTKPVYASPSVAKLVTAKYQWKVNGKAVKSAKRPTFKVTKKYAKKRIAVRVTFTAKGYKPLVKNVSFGKAKR